MLVGIACNSPVSGTVQNVKSYDCMCHIFLFWKSRGSNDMIEESVLYIPCSILTYIDAHANTDVIVIVICTFILCFSILTFNKVEYV